MKSYLILLGATYGGWRRGWAGAVLGAGAGWVVGSLLRPVRSRAGDTRAAEEHYLRYPEEEMVDALQDAEDEPAAEGAELDDLYREVTGGKG